jgi:hypothetical protein
MTRPTDPRGASRRKPTAFGENIGMDVANNAPPRPPAQPGAYYPPATIQQINAVMRQVRATGRCAVCGQPKGDDGFGATCKQSACISKWILGR